MKEHMPHGLRPLTGVRVLELGNYMAGPYCGTLLADLGADVIKVENPRGGDFTRLTGPFIEGQSAGFLALNRNKRSAAIDLKEESARAIFLTLARTADVIIENLRPGTIDQLGIGYERLRESNPRLIFCSISGFGRAGPNESRAALDLIIQGVSGLMSITGEPGRPPSKIGVPISDLSAALFAVYGVLAALRARDQFGKGQRIDVSLLESAMALAIWETSSYFATGQVPEPLGSAHRVVAPYQAVRTADTYITVGADTPRNWTAFCAALDLRHLENDGRFATVSARRSHYIELAALIEEVTVGMPSAHWVKVLDRAGVPCGVLNRIDAALADEQVRALGFLTELTHTTIGKVKSTGSPVHFSMTPVKLDRAGPMLGEHTSELLAELGVARAEIAELQRVGAIKVSDRG